jgi:hypothetical protein
MAIREYKVRCHDQTRQTLAIDGQPSGRRLEAAPAATTIFAELDRGDFEFRGGCGRLWLRQSGDYQ